MRKIFTDNLPHGGKGINKSYINWKESVGYKIKFIYDNIRGEVEIVGWYKKNNISFLKVKYKNNILDISSGHLLKCELGKLFDIRTYNYRYNTGDIITDVHSGKLKLLEQTTKKNEKAYKYRCLICGNEDIITEYTLNKCNSGCNVCSNQKVLKGYNEKYVIEAQGLQHYQETHIGRGKGRTVEEEKENDKLKKKLALKNGIKKDNYIVIDCRKSELEWIKEHILNSKLNDIFDLSKIDWLKCHEYACSSLVKKACELWISGIHNTKDIGKILKLNSNAIVKYLKQGAKLDWCDYNAKEITRRKIICLNNKKIFSSIIQASIHYAILAPSNITMCCKNKYRHTGKDPITGEYLQWQYYSEYLIEPKKLLNNNEIDEITNYNINKDIRRKVICLNNNKVFNSITEAGKYYSIKSSSHIGGCCQNKRSYAGVNQKTKEYLQWQYYEEYLIKPKKLLSNGEIDKMINYKEKIKKTPTKKIICLNNKKIFNSIVQAGEYYNFASANIISCCKGKYKHCGKDPKTGEKLKWMYYNEYLKQQSQQNQKAI